MLYFNALVSVEPDLVCYFHVFDGNLELLLSW